MKPLAPRFDVVNVFDTLYQIRSGTASACSRRNMGRGEAFSLDCRRNFDGTKPPQL